MELTSEHKDSAERQLKEFEEALRQSMPAGLGAPLTRSEAALLRTFILWRAQQHVEQNGTALSEVPDVLCTEPPSGPESLKSQGRP